MFTTVCRFAVWQSLNRPRITAELQLWIWIIIVLTQIIVSIVSLHSNFLLSFRKPQIFHDQPSCGLNFRDSIGKNMHTHKYIHICISVSDTTKTWIYICVYVYNCCSWLVHTFYQIWPQHMPFAKFQPNDEAKLVAPSKVHEAELELLSIHM